MLPPDFEALALSLVTLAMALCSAVLTARVLRPLVMAAWADATLE